MSQIAKPSPLGRGLSALFGDTDSSYQAKAPGAHTQPTVAGPADGRGAVRMLSLTWLQPGAYQPRRVFDEDALNGLADSIRERGILEPLLVRPAPGARDQFEIIAGERRWRAAQIVGLHEVPVLVRELTDREALEFGLIENIQRQDLSPLEEAEGYQRLLGEFGHTQEVLARIVGKSRPHITNMLRLLTLPVSVKQLIDEGKLTVGHARAIIPCRDPMLLAEEIIRRGLNVRQAESLAKKHIDNPETHKRKPAHGESSDVLQLEKDIEKLTGLRAKIQTRGKEGTLTFHYKDLDQLDDIIKRLRA